MMIPISNRHLGGEVTAPLQVLFAIALTCYSGGSVGFGSAVEVAGVGDGGCLAGDDQLGGPGLGRVLRRCAASHGVAFRRRCHGVLLAA